MAVFIESSNIISSLGFSLEENYENVLSGRSGVKEYVNSPLSDVPLQASLVDNDLLNGAFMEVTDGGNYTRFEKLAILSVSKSLRNSLVDITSDRTILILSTTKGNVDLLEDPKGFGPERLYLWHSAGVVARFFSAANTPMVVSNACISGVSALVLAKRLIDAGRYDHAVVVGADVTSRFIVSGFQSFMSLSANRCKPFDAGRNGLNIGEAAASVVVTNRPTQSREKLTEIVRGAIHNDANHISGPSRTGEGLFHAITDAVAGDSVDFISAHGTATPYNDNMEAVAIGRAGLNHVPVNSIKAFFGHTLGAAGLLESIIAMEAMKHNTVIATLGYETCGVTEQINVAAETSVKDIRTVLKLASGFGGSNAAVLLKKTE
ncbi:MAG: beta-ketoacyl synthase N-terminal-like domain-containing protein [Breznakibacter sp.]